VFCEYWNGLDPVTTGTLFYLTVCTHSSLGPFGVQAVSAKFAAVQLGHSPRSTRFATYNVVRLMLSVQLTVLEQGVQSIFLRLAYMPSFAIFTARSGFIRKLDEALSRGWRHLSYVNC
jgi:hypothetical protein